MILDIKMYILNYLIELVNNGLEQRTKKNLDRVNALHMELIFLQK